MIKRKTPATTVKKARGVSKIKLKKFHKIPSVTTESKRIQRLIDKRASHSFLIFDLREEGWRVSAQKEEAVRMFRQWIASFYLGDPFSLGAHCLSLVSDELFSPSCTECRSFHGRSAHHARSGRRVMNGIRAIASRRRAIYSIQRDEEESPQRSLFSLFAARFSFR